MAGWKGTSFNPTWVDKLVECMGLYPIGTLVQLNNGCIGFVKLVNHAHLGCPVVVTLFDSKNRKSMDRQVVDLLDMKEKNLSNPISIDRVVSPNYWEFDLETCLFN